jgi:hypothetical protein
MGIGEPETNRTRYSSSRGLGTIRTVTSDDQQPQEYDRHADSDCTRACLAGLSTFLSNRAIRKYGPCATATRRG